MNIATPNRMTVDEFLRWYERQESGRYELQNGRVIVQQAQNRVHRECKVLVYLALARAIERAGVDYYAEPDGATVRIDADITYEPDALVAPLPKPPPTALDVPNPVIVVEVLSPRGKKRDLGDKVSGYARISSIAHYLVLDPMSQILWHHTRATMLAVAEPRRVTEALLRLDPPGIEIVLGEIFPIPRDP